MEAMINSDSVRKKVSYFEKPFVEEGRTRRNNHDFLEPCKMLQGSLQGLDTHLV